MKTEVLAAIGEAGLRRPAAVNAALAANDRVKYVLALLQTAAAHADDPNRPVAALRHERVACGIADRTLDSLAETARRLDGSYQIPGAARLLERIAADMRQMAVPVIDAGGSGFASRLDALLAAFPNAAHDMLDAGTIEAMTRAGKPGSDSLHQLVMDLHKALNAQQAELAEETIDGACAYGLTAADRPRVAAFMAGLNRTAKLKFNHPGLGTTATRCNGTLVIQNDVGATDAHVIVAHVQGLAVSVTCTDVHEERLAFLRDMLACWQPVWSGGGSGHLGGTEFQLITGRFTAADEAQCRAYLEFLGSRLVFLIDWNRARKQLRGFLPNTARLALLRWAADQEVGHRGFLELGGARLVNQAIEAVAGSAIHFGDRLCDVLGVEETEAFLRFVLRTATEGLMARQSASLIRDRVRAELARHLSNEERRLLQVAAEHAGLIFELAALVRDAVLAVAAGEEIGSAATRARDFEHDADRLVAAIWRAVKRRPDLAPFLPLLRSADDAADELEEAAFLLRLLTARPPTDPVLQSLQSLVALLLEAAQEWVKVLAHARHVHDPGSAEAIDDLLTALDRVAALEHRADDAERLLAEAALRHAADFRDLHIYAALGDKLEAAADALKRSSLLLRDEVLGDVLGA
jgi:uncharacterized protein Yka (UPF0111/DUF47 family)